MKDFEDMYDYSLENNKNRFLMFLLNDYENSNLNLQEPPNSAIVRLL